MWFQTSFLLNLSVPAPHIIRGCLLSVSTESTGFQPQYARTPFILFLHVLKSSVSKAFHSVQSWQSELLLMLISSCYNHSPNTTEACHHGYGWYPSSFVAGRFTGVHLCHPTMLHNYSMFHVIILLYQTLHENAQMSPYLHITFINLQ